MSTLDDSDELEELTQAFEKQAHKFQLELVADLRARGMSEDEIDTEVCLLEARIEHEIREQFAAIKRGFNEKETRH